MPTQLRGVEGKEISLVMRAANRRRYLLTKGDGTMALDEVKALQHVEKIDAAGLGSVIEALAGSDPTIPEAVSKMAGSDEDRVRLKAAARILGADFLAKLAKSSEPPPKVSEPDVPPAIKDLIAKAEAREAEARADLRKAQEKLVQQEAERENAEAVQKAAAFRDLPGANPDDLGPMLVAIRKALKPEQYEKLVQMLTGAAAIVKQSALFREMGSRSGEGTSEPARSELQGLVAELRKSDSHLTVEQARAKVLRANPDLFKRVQAEDSARLKRAVE